MTRIEVATQIAAALLSQQRPHVCPRCAGYGTKGPNQELAAQALAIADALIAAAGGEGRGDGDKPRPRCPTHWGGPDGSRCKREAGHDGEHSWGANK